MPDSERQRRVETLHSAALQLDAGERDTFLRQACGGDAELRRAVESLLAYEPELDGFLEGPPLPTVVLDQAAAQPPRWAGQTLRTYRLLQPIGSGGMGEVWLAEQKQPVRRRVALKLIKAGMDTREVVARFESERQALALMDHPAIAKVFDAGSTEQGAPYFAMEYVDGIPITAYCDTHRLSTRERLELFMHVCEGVQHAHQKAIIHRDLKPSNILVTELDGQAAPKIIDFGVAKALTQKLTDHTMFTRLGALVGTPEYMSPEQTNSLSEDIDTRTDVYSLGVIFYELLAGVPPLDLRTDAFEELLRKLREEEPQRPSTKIRVLDQARWREIARRRQSEPQALVKQIRGDLDSIALKALEKERSRRYGSPSDFAADIRRYLNNEAVLAVTASAAYRARKFAYRHRVALVTACAFVLVLILAASVSIWQSVRATKQRDRADAEAAAAQAVNDFLQKDLLAQASAAAQSGPKSKPDADLKVRTALDRAAARISGRFGQQPEVEAAIRDTIGETYMDLGLYPEAGTQLVRALDLHRRVLGAENPKTLKTMSLLGRIAFLQGRYAEAAILFSQVLDIQRRLLGSEHPDTLYSMTHLATVYYRQGKYAQAEALHSQALEIRRRVQGPEHPDALTSVNGLASDYYAEGKYAQAEALYSQNLEIRRRVLGSEHPDTLTSMNNLADAYIALGKYAQADALFSQTVEIERRVLGSEHPLTLSSTNGLAGAYTAQGKYAQAEAIFNRNLQIRRRVLGAEHPDTLITLADLVFMYQRQGKYALAATYAAQVLAVQRRSMGAQDTDTMVSAADLALAYVSQGKFTASESLAREALAVYRQKQPDDWQAYRAESLLGASLAGQKKYAEAEPLLLEGYQGMAARKDRIAVPDRYHLDRARDWIAQFYEAWGKPEKAAEWSKK